MPPDYCEVVDTMEHWGMRLNPEWKSRVLQGFHLFLDLDLGGFHNGATQFEVFNFAITELINSKYSSCPYYGLEAKRALLEFLYDKHTQGCSFFKLTCSALRFMQSEIRSIREATESSSSSDSSTAITPDRVVSIKVEEESV